MKGISPLASSSGIIDSHNEYKVKAPGIVTGRSGSIGNVFCIEDDFWPLNTVLYIKEFYGNDVRFVYYFLKQFDLQRFSSGAGVPTLNRNFVHGERVSVPSNISEQKQIVSKLDFLSAEVKRLEGVYERKVECLEELRKSVLGKAFRGEL